MKFLPWAVLAAILVYSLAFGQISPGPDPQKVYGAPAASEWMELESGIAGQPGMQFTVPSRKVLTMVYMRLRPGQAPGTVNGTVDIDGQEAFSVALDAGEFKRVQSISAAPWVLGEVARAGQVVTLTVTSIPNAPSFFVRGWLEDEL